jgi:hypothetical protein
MYEPVAGSGESITIAIAAYSETDSDLRVIQTLQEKNMNCLFSGLRTKSISDQIRIIIESLEKTEGDFENWSPPLSGFNLGGIRTAYDENMLEIINQGIRQSTALTPLLNSLEQEQADVKHRWGVMVRQEIIKQSPELKGFVGRRVGIGSGNATIMLDFYNNEYAASFINLGTLLSTDTAIAKVVKMNMFKVKTPQKIESEVFVNFPNSSERNAMSSSQKSKLDDAISMIKDTVSGFSDVGMKEVSSHIEAATSIVKKMAA